MRGVTRPVLRILPGDCPIADHEQIFRVAVFRLLGEIERAGDDHGVVENDDHIVFNPILPSILPPRPLPVKPAYDPIFPIPITP